MGDKINIGNIVKMVEYELTESISARDREIILNDFKAVLNLDLELYPGDTQEDKQEILDYETKKIIEHIKKRDILNLKRYLRRSRLLLEIYHYDEEIQQIVWDTQMDKEERKKKAERIYKKVREYADELESMGFKPSHELKWAISETLTDCMYIIDGRISSLRTGRKLRQHREHTSSEQGR